jgi:hypothetical protein
LDGHWIVAPLAHLIVQPIAVPLLVQNSVLQQLLRSPQPRNWADVGLSASPARRKAEHSNKAISEYIFFIVDSFFRR